MQVGQQTVSLRAILEQWSMYKQAYDEIQGYLMEGRYTISRLRLLTGSPEAVQVQVENLEVLIFLSLGCLIDLTLYIINQI